MPRILRRLTVAVIALAFMVTACQAFGVTTSKPTVVISAPPSGTVFNIGQDVAVTSTSTDPQGITRVELLVDGLTVRNDPSPVAQGQAQFSVIQTWKASTSGTHTVTVRAYNTSGAFGEGGVNVTVNDAVAGQPTGVSTAVSIPTAPAVDTPIPIPTSTSAPPPPPTAAPPPTNTSVPAGCLSNSAFVADISIPDGTVLGPGATFNKTWRVTNTGSCAWDTSYAILYVGGTQLGLQTALPIPVAAPGQTVDVTVPMRAPILPGNYQSVWRLRDSYGVPFGTNLTSVISVPGPNPPTAVPTVTPTNPPSGPNITSFYCSAPAIPSAQTCNILPGQPVTLHWGLVTNATMVTIDQGIGGVGTPGSRALGPQTASRVFTMTAVGPAGTMQRLVTINIVPAVVNFGGAYHTNFGTMTLIQSGPSVSGTYYNAFESRNGTVAGNVNGNILDGTFSIGGGSGTVHWEINGNQLTGNWNSTAEWCGAKDGTAFPAGCSYAGTFKISSNVCANGTMIMQRIDDHVTGTYCTNRSVSGTVSYSGQQTVLTGNWFLPPTFTGNLTFYLLGYQGDQFRGNYNSGSFQWCGWRSASTQPSPCLQ